MSLVLNRLWGRVPDVGIGLLPELDYSTIISPYGARTFFHGVAQAPPLNTCGILYLPYANGLKLHFNPTVSFKYQPMIQGDSANVTDFVAKVTTTLTWSFPKGDYINSIHRYGINYVCFEDSHLDNYSLRALRGTMKYTIDPNDSNVQFTFTMTNYAHASVPVPIAISSFSELHSDVQSYRLLSDIDGNLRKIHLQIGLLSRPWWTDRDQFMDIINQLRYNVPTFTYNNISRMVEGTLTISPYDFTTQSINLPLTEEPFFG